MDFRDLAATTGILLYTAKYNTADYQWRTLRNMGGGEGGCLCRRHGKILKFGSRKWHLQHSENTFCKKISYKSHAKHRKSTFQRKYLHDY